MPYRAKLVLDFAHGERLGIAPRSRRAVSGFVGRGKTNEAENFG
jgi:hypothetical protein